MSLPGCDAFVDRHVGPSDQDVAAMLDALGVASLDALIDQTVPEQIRLSRPLDLPTAASEVEALDALRLHADANRVRRSYLGMGYHNCITPPVILRNVIENPGWYTAYTPYQAEISQGRLEALLLFQTVVQELCGMEVANASMLDEATAAAEAMTMAWRVCKKKGCNAFFVDDRCHPQVLEVVRTRAEPLGIDIVLGRGDAFDPTQTSVFGLLLPYPCTDGLIMDWRDLASRARDSGALVCVCSDLLALTVLREPGAWGADIVVGNSQRLGVPLGYGGPHAGFLATRAKHQRQMPGRIIGVSVDSHGAPALRMALQTREQHIRRQRATSNICTAQVLLAVVAAMYAVWHGPEGLVRIATRTRGFARAFADGVTSAGLDVASEDFFDTVCVVAGDRRDELVARAAGAGINVRSLGEDRLCVAFDETVTEADLADLFAAFGVSEDVASVVAAVDAADSGRFARTSSFLQEPVFHRHRSETEMLRYLRRLQGKDLALDQSMIPLGSCTMKLNATTEMIPVTWPGFNALHPCAPEDQAQGFSAMCGELETWLAEITGFDAVSMQPNAGSQGEYAGLLAIRGWHGSQGDGAKRDVCLIPTSAHGTNPASAVLAGMKVQPVKCDDAGNIDLVDLRKQAEAHADRLGALMVTYPSTHGVFEPTIREVCDVIHRFGGQVYLDGANMNAMVGVARPGDFGADVCHLNLHKTFCIPHGGGGPGMGPIGVKRHLAPFLPGDPMGSNTPVGAVSAAKYGSPSILPISWAYIRMLGHAGLRRCTEVAILNANYIAQRMQGAFDVLYTGPNGRVAHECILDFRPFKAHGVLVEDIAKRLMDYGFHAPTMAFPVADTIMVEPTESEGREELDRFCEALLSIREEIRAVERGDVAIEDSPLRHAPHTAGAVTATEWKQSYTREQAAFPAPWTKAHKIWPAVGRIDNAHGDRHLICSCDAWPVDGAPPST